MKSVVILGNKRFKIEIKDSSQKLKRLGVVVFEPHLHSNPDAWDTFIEEYKKYLALGLTHDHLYKIRVADVVFL